MYNQTGLYPAPIWRIVAATLLSGVTWLFLGGLLVVVLADVQHSPAKEYFTSMQMFWMFVSTSALGSIISALIFAAAVEWPKTRWMIRNDQENLALSMIISVMAALSFSLAMAAAMMFFLPPIAPDFNAAHFYINTALNASIGGLCSALYWWFLVVKPLRS